MHKLSQGEFVELLQALRFGKALTEKQQQVVRAAVQAALAANPGVTNTREFVIDAVKAAYTFVDPTKPQTLFVEYVGACKRRDGFEFNRRWQWTQHHLGQMPSQQEPYASGWVDDGWNIVFPEAVLRAFFPLEQPFDGNFHKLLLQSEDLAKTFKQLARKYHPDVNGGRSKYFLKLKKAYDDLKDPMRRKRYEAGLKFQQAVVEKVDDVLFRIPKSCGMVTVVGEHDNHSRLKVSQILSWEDIKDKFGRTMVAKWGATGFTKPLTLVEKPFYHEYEFKGDIEFEVTI